MSLLIDGYNVIFGASIVGHGRGPGSLERSRLALLNFVADAVGPNEAARTTVVFDAAGSPPGLPLELWHRGVRVRFARNYEDADSLIEEMILAESAPRRLTVVSSDHRLQRAAHRRKAQAIDSDQWYAQVARERDQRRRQPKQPTTLKPPAPSQDEVAFWLGRFVDSDAATDSETSKDVQAEVPKKKPRAEPPKDGLEPGEMDDIFPPGYAEDLDDE
jgi:predicted RNA-binding protein with PIN domain